MHHSTRDFKIHRRDAGAERGGAEVTSEFLHRGSKDGRLASDSLHIPLIPEQILTGPFQKRTRVHVGRQREQDAVRQQPLLEQEIVRVAAVGQGPDHAGRELPAFRQRLPEQRLDPAQATRESVIVVTTEQLVEPAPPLSRQTHQLRRHHRRERFDEAFLQRFLLAGVDFLQQVVGDRTKQLPQVGHLPVQFIPHDCPDVGVIRPLRVVEPMLLVVLPIPLDRLHDPAHERQPLGIGIGDAIDEPVIAKRREHVGMARQQPGALVPVKRALALDPEQCREPIMIASGIQVTQLQWCMIRHEFLQGRVPLPSSDSGPPMPAVAVVGFPCRSRIMSPRSGCRHLVRRRNLIHRNHRTEQAREVCNSVRATAAATQA